MSTPPGQDAATTPAVTAGKPRQWSGFKRYQLSNGWFIDGAQRPYLYHQGWKYSLWEPGASPTGGAAWRGGGPTLALAVAVANGASLCGHAQYGCRETATGFRTVQVGGREGRFYHCENHRPAAGRDTAEPGDDRALATARP